MYDRKYLFESEPMKIGRREWRAVVYDASGYLGTQAFTDYEWRTPRYVTAQGVELDPVGEWKSMKDYPGYDSNDGSWAGCPKTLRKLYERHQEKMHSALVDAVI